MYFPNTVDVESLDKLFYEFPIRFSDLYCPEILGFSDSSTGDPLFVPSTRAPKSIACHNDIQGEGTLATISTPSNFVIANSNKAA
jgi:hypothetical protein